MKKIMMVLLALVGVILLACKVGQDPKPQEAIAQGQSEDQNQGQPKTNVDGPLLLVQDPAQEGAKPKEEAQPIVEPIPDRPLAPITHFDTEKLDNEVRAEAARFKQDPKTYRKFIRKDEYGTEIYRVLGMHIIKNPDGEEVFLPDEI